MRILTILLCLVSLSAGATDKYYVGGTHTSSDANIWYLEDAHTNVTTAPTSADNVYFTANSTSGALTLDAAFNCKDFNQTGYTGSFNDGGKAFRIYGNTIVLNGTFTSSVNVSITPTGNCNVTGNGKSFNRFILTAVNDADELVFQDNYTQTSGYMAVTKGVININGKTVTVSHFTLGSGGSVKGLKLSGGTLILTGQSTAMLDFETNATNFTFTHGNGTIRCRSGNSGALFKGNNNTFYTVIFDGNTAGATISGNNNFTTLTFTPASGKTYQFTDGSTQTVTTFTASGSFGKHITLTGTSTGGWTLSKSSGTVNCDWLKLSYSTATGGATWNAGINSCNITGNSGWDFTRPGYIVNGYIAY